MNANSILSPHSTEHRIPQSFYQQILYHQKQNPQHLLMVRVGDFYEFYSEQAKVVSQTLGLKIAKSNQLDFCGFPSYKIRDYVKSLLGHGFSIAKLEQYERLQVNGERIITRHIDRIYTSGTVVEEELQEKESFLLSLYQQNEQIGFTCVDLTTGKFQYGITSLPDLQTKLSILKPLEILINNPSLKEPISSCLGEDVSLVERKEKDLLILDKYLDNFDDIKEVKQQPDCIQFSMSTLLSYIAEAHGGALPFLEKPTMFNMDIVWMDLETQRSLELLQSQKRREKHGSLLSLLDQTSTRSGSKLLHQQITSPTRNLQQIQRRLSKVAFFKQHDELNKQLRNVMREKCHWSMSQALQNLGLNYGGWWHLANFYECFHGLLELNSILNDKSKEVESTKELENWLDNREIRMLSELSQFLESILPASYLSGEMQLPDLPKSFQTGLLNPKANQELEELSQLNDKIPDLKKDLELKLKKDFKLSSNCQISFENKKPFGPYIEIETFLDQNHFTNINYIPLPSKNGLLSSTSRNRKKKYKFRNEKWTKLSHQIEMDIQKYIDTEKLAFKKVCEILLQCQQEILKWHEQLSELDICSTFGYLSKQHNWNMPSLIEENGVFKVIKGRHPVIENSLMKLRHEQFTANSCYLSTEQPIWLLTGPNMGGKSSFLRQNALILIMAHLGCFVPCEKADLSLVDAIFSRVGGSDDVSQHQSSFYVEMKETAHILQHATSKSFVIVDELGRGTSFEDGKAIAMAVVLYLSKNVKSKTLFATHYHCLVDYFHKEHQMDAYCTHVIERNEQLSFTHRIQKGISYDSFGLNVARLAGIPKEVLQNAKMFKLNHQHFSKK